jgi:hypothetical protein
MANCSPLVTQQMDPNKLKKCIRPMINTMCILLPVALNVIFNGRRTIDGISCAMATARVSLSLKHRPYDLPWFDKSAKSTAAGRNIMLLDSSCCVPAINALWVKAPTYYTSAELGESGYRGFSIPRISLIPLGGLNSTLIQPINILNRFKVKLLHPYLKFRTILHAFRFSTCVDHSLIMVIRPS